MKFIKFLVVGFVFGIVLTKSEAVSWYRIYEMFYFQSFHMFGIISVAIATGIVGIQIIKKNNEFIPAKCFDKNSKIYLQLENGKIVTLIAIDQETCGEAISKESENVRALTGYFLFMKESFQDLKKSPVSLMRIKFAGETEDYVLKSELISESNQNTYFPQNYFINYLKCVE